MCRLRSRVVGAFGCRSSKDKEEAAFILRRSVQFNDPAFKMNGLLRLADCRQCLLVESGCWTPFVR